jgi:hypothetical protein
MAIQYSFSTRGQTLLVKASGWDEDLEEVQRFGLAIIAAAVERQCQSVLSDERELEYRLNTVDTYAAAVFIAEHAPLVSQVAIVCRADMARDAGFWEDVAVNRGLRVKMFQDLPAAEAWLELPAASATH